MVACERPNSSATTLSGIFVSQPEHHHHHHHHHHVQRQHVWPTNSWLLPVRADHLPHPGHQLGQLLPAQRPVKCSQHGGCASTIWVHTTEVVYQATGCVLPRHIQELVTFLIIHWDRDTINQV